MCSYPLLKKEAFPEPRSTSPPLVFTLAFLESSDTQIAIMLEFCWHLSGCSSCTVAMVSLHWRALRSLALLQVCFELLMALTHKGTDHGAVPVNRRLFVWDEFVFWRKGGTTLYYIVLAEMNGSAGLTKRERSLAGDDRRGRSERKKPHGRRGYTLSDRGRW